MNVIDQLAEYLAQGRLALFIGADLPRSVTGLPDRAELAEGLARRYGLPPSRVLAAVAQRVGRNDHRNEFTGYLIEQLDTLNKQPQPFHQIIARLPVKTIITTAYDDLLEEAHRAASVPLKSIVRDIDIPLRGSGRLLIKLYGDVRQIDTLVVTENDHYALWHNNAKMSVLNRVRDIFSSHAVVFLGYNLSDPDFNLLWREMLDWMKQFAIGAYAVSPGMAIDDQQVWQERQVRVIDMEPVNVLEQLAARSSAQEPPPPKLPSPAAPENLTRPSAEVIRQQQELLLAHRRTLAILLVQQAQQTQSYAPPSIYHGIAEARTQIRRIKSTLRGWGLFVDDQPSDEESMTS